MFEQLRHAAGDHKREVFDELSALLTVHEAGEKAVLRPISRRIVGPGVADVRDEEESQCTIVCAELGLMDVESPRFDIALAAFEQNVVRHAEAEDSQEFSAVLSSCTVRKLEDLGRSLLAIEHP